MTSILKPYLAYGLAPRHHSPFTATVYRASMDAPFSIENTHLVETKCGEVARGLEKGREVFLMLKGCEILMQGYHLRRLPDLLTIYELTLLQRFDSKLYTLPPPNEPIIENLYWRTAVETEQQRVNPHPHPARFIVFSRDTSKVI